jgi:Adenylate and Guanylate cyclase catalytic domain
LGKGDHHDPKYNGRVISRQLHESMDIYRYSGATLDSEHCPYTINLYPSDEYENYYVTNNAGIFSMSVVLIFAFVSLVFFVYDANVERRQKLVVNTAEKTSAIVTSLFPSAVRHQMLQDIGKKEPATKSKLVANRFFKGTYDIESEEIANRNTTGNAMANLYPETTIFFADLAGFTAWSSSRTPCQVFTLLEVLYGAFDHLASRRKVFKVETIGDCYVAATGLVRRG